MNIHQIRSATCVIEAGGLHVLVDPMLSAKGALPPFVFFRHPPRRNPTAELPPNAGQILEKVTHCLITHSQKWGIEALTHTDHFDRSGKRFLRDHEIPVICRKGDAAYMSKNGLSVIAAPDYWTSEDVLGGRITAVPARHGHGWIHGLMANGAGFLIELPGEPTVYISGDTVYTEDVERVLTEMKPDIAIVAAGGARMDIGGPILMPLAEVMAFIEKAPGKVVANHQEALNHCPVTREQLKNALANNGLMTKTIIPEDGESISF